MQEKKQKKLLPLNLQCFPSLPKLQIIQNKKEHREILSGSGERLRSHFFKERARAYARFLNYA